MVDLGQCIRCKKRKAKVRFNTEPVFALTHGFGWLNYCRQCYVQVIEEELKQINDNLKKQKKLIKRGK